MSSKRSRIALGLAVVAVVSLVWRQRIISTPAFTEATPAANGKSTSVAPVGAAADPAICAPTNPSPGAKFESAVAARAHREDALAKNNAFNDWLTRWRQ